MRKHAIAQVLIAALIALPSAYAGINDTTTSTSNVGLSTSPGSDVVPAVQGDASPAPQSAPATGGAFFSPFAMAPVKPARQEPESAWLVSPDSADLTFSVGTSLAAVAAIAYILRRASR